MKLASVFLLGAVVAAGPALAADPVRIGVTTVLSGPTYDRGESELYGVELALQQVNEAGGVLGRPVEAFYGDNAANPDIGVPATKRLIEQEHVSAIIGALATPVTHAVMPVVKDAKIPLLIATSAGQDFVDASGVGGNEYLFKTIPSDLDIARGLIGWLKPQGVHRVAIIADDNPFNHANAESQAKAAGAAGMEVVENTVIAKGTTDLGPIVAHLGTLGLDRVLVILGPSTAPFFQAYEKSGWTVPIAGRFDFGVAQKAVSPGFLAAGGLAKTAGIAVFTTALDTPGVQGFVRAYSAKYGLMPTQRSFYTYEAANLIVDAIRRAGSDKPADVEKALKSSTMPSLLGGTYAMDDHNHPHTPMQIIGLRDGKVTVIASAQS